MSKGLEALDYLKRNRRRHYLEDDKSIESLDAIEKDLHALEIIKNNCDIDTLIGVFSKTEEEYNLLKEVLL